MFKILVCGYGRHGKDTFCELIAKNRDVKFTSSSEYCLKNVIWPAWGVKYYATQKDCFNDRHNNRDTWFNLISRYNGQDRARLQKDVLINHDIYCGLRCADEFNAAKAANLYSVTLWVDASKRLPPEDTSSCTITPDMCDIVVDNNGSLEDLEAKANSFAYIWWGND